MIYEQKFEQKTNGIICGIPTLIDKEPCAYRLIKPKKEWLFTDPVKLIPGRPSYKIVIKARDGGEIVWKRPFATVYDAFSCWVRLVGVDLERIVPGRPYTFANVVVDGDLEYVFATVATYTSSNSTNADWPTGNRAPAGVSAVDYLIVAGGGGSGGGTSTTGGGGGGAGQVLSSTGLSVTPGTQYTITVGTKGTGKVQPTAAPTNGSSSVFSSVTSLGGGYGGDSDGDVGNQGGSGGGGAGGGAGRTAGGASNGTGTNAGGYGNFNNTGSGSGGGGGALSGGLNGDGAGIDEGGNGGNGLSNSISGSSITYGGGGGGTGASAPGTGGLGGGGDGDNSGVSSGNNATGYGSGGGGGNDYNNGGNGSDGIIILSFTPVIPKGVFINMPVMGM